jgi:hypothetical protein
LLTSQRFGTSAREAKNGFVRSKNCFVARPLTKQLGQKCEYFQGAENRKISEPEKFPVPPLNPVGIALEIALGLFGVRWPHRGSSAMSSHA